MSIYITAPHVTMLPLASISVAVADGAQQIREALTTNRMYEKFVFRMTPEFTHGETPASGPKFGGIYNLIKGAHILFNSNDKAYVKSGMTLYVDSFKRQGREDDNVDYSNLPTKLTQEIDYSFEGNHSVLGGVLVPNSGFGLDLRHDKTAGPNTYNSVELVLDINELGAVFENLNETALTKLTIEVYGVQTFHDAASAKTLAVDTSRYAQIVTNTDMVKIMDVTQAKAVNLPAVGEASKGVFLSDLAIVQTDEAGKAVPFDDENQIVSVKVGENDFYSLPIWQVRRLQNARRLQPVPPNVLIVPLVQFASGRGGLSPQLLQSGASVTVKANKLAGQTGETCLHVEKNYTYKG